jgi:Ser/Thr protein kinase RdoA (MazF antagonist)
LTFPEIAHSVPTGRAVGALLQDPYALGGPPQARLFAKGLNDTYAVEVGDRRYVFRLYRRRWRTEDDVRFELDFVAHAAANGAPVAAPVVRRDGGLLTWVEAPEGRRMGVLFEHAPGEGYALRGKAGGQNTEKYAAAVARLHHASEGFASTARRFALDMRHLLDEPTAALGAFLRDRPDDARYLADVGAFLRRRIDDLAADGLEWAVCHGDLHGGNAHLHPEHGLTFFDFDCCGMGHRAYELAVFRWTTALPGQNTGTSSFELWDRFLAAYREHRAVGDRELAATDAYVPIRHVWWMGMRAINADDFGSQQWLDKRFFDEHLGLIAAWCANHLPDAPPWASRR